MAPRRLLGGLLVVALATACNDKGKSDDKSGGAKPPATAADLDKRCEQVAKVCGDKAKHVDKILAECREAAKKQVADGCTDKTIAVYDCYVRDLCAEGDKVWTIDDVKVLAERHGRCLAEQTANRNCVKK